MVMIRPFHLLICCEIARDFAKRTSNGLSESLVESLNFLQGRGHAFYLILQ
jgi:hypothetical protein